jgi:hypothetical protein
MVAPPQPGKTFQATTQQKEADRYADILCKFFRAVPSSQLESIDKAILDEFVRADIWAQERDQDGRPRVNFRTIALKLGVDERTISRRWNDRLQYSNLIKSHHQDEKTGRWYILIDRALYTQAALAYHTAMKQAANAGQPKISDPELLTFSAPVAQRGTCTHCQVPMETSKMEKRDMVITYYRCPKCKRRHKQVVKDSGWKKPEAQDENTPTSCQAFKEAVTPPMAALVELYLALAGEDPTHIRMTDSGDPKYTSHPDKLSGDQINAHLAGDDTHGSRMWRKDGLARGFLVDGDNARDIERLEQGAAKLAAEGFLPIREYIPESRPRDVDGYHNESRRYVLVMDALVDVRAGWQRIFEIAPEWEGLEHWPLPGEARGNRTRLPGGLYRMPGFSGWCELYSLTSYESSSNGIEAAALLYTHQSAASLIPPYSEPPRVDKSEHLVPILPLPDASDSDQVADRSENNHFLIAFKACDLAARFADEHQLADYLERGKNGKYFSPNGDERTASAAVYEKDGRELVTDFSTHGSRSDGTHDTVDVLDLYSRQSGRVKRDVLKELGQVVHREAKAAIEATAHGDMALPGWIESRLTHSGRATYERLRLAAGGVTALNPSLEPQSDKEQLSLEAEGYYKDTDELDPGWPPSMKMKKRVYVPPVLWAAVMP